MKKLHLVQGSNCIAIIGMMLLAATLFGLTFKVAEATHSATGAVLGGPLPIIGVYSPTCHSFSRVRNVFITGTNGHTDHGGALYVPSGNYDARTGRHTSWLSPGSMYNGLFGGVPIVANNIERMVTEYSCGGTINRDRAVFLYGRVFALGQTGSYIRSLGSLGMPFNINASDFNDGPGLYYASGITQAYIQFLNKTIPYAYLAARIGTNNWDKRDRTQYGLGEVAAGANLSLGVRVARGATCTVTNLTTGTQVMDTATLGGEIPTRGCLGTCSTGGTWLDGGSQTISPWLTVDFEVPIPVPPAGVLHEYEAFCTTGDASVGTYRTTIRIGGRAVPPTVDLTASSNSVASGETVTLSWAVTGSPDYCTATNNAGNTVWTGTVSGAGASMQVPITASGDYNIQCFNTAGSSSLDTETIAVTALTPPVVTLVPSAPSATIGTDISLTWTVTGSADSCVARSVPSNLDWYDTSGGGTYINPTGGTLPVTVQYLGVNEFKLFCTNAAGNSNIERIYVDGVLDPVLNPPVVTLTPGSTAVPANGQTTLTWTVTGAADSCTATSNPNNPNWTSTIPLSPIGGVTTVTIPAGVNDFSVVCASAAAGPGAPASAQVVGTVAGSVPNVDLTVDQTNVSIGDSVTLDWTITGGAADYCQATSNPGNTAWNNTNLNPAAGPITVTITQAGANQFTLQCFNFTGAGAPDQETVTAAVVAGPAPTVSLVPDKTVMYTTDTLNLTYSSSDATTCDATSAVAAWSGSIPPNVTGTTPLSGLSAGTYTFNFACTNAQGTTPATPVQVTVYNAGLVNVTADSPVNFNESTDITWTAQNVVSCTPSTSPVSTTWDGSGAGPGTGNHTVNSITESLVFSLQCTDALGNSYGDSAPVTVLYPQPTIEASPSLVRSGNPVTVTWDPVGQYTDCELTPTSIGPITQDATGFDEPGSDLDWPTSFTLYRISCAGGSAFATVAVEVLPNIEET